MNLLETVTDTRVAGTGARVASTWDTDAAASQWRRALGSAAPERVGAVRSVVGLSIEVVGIDCAVGDLVTLGDAHVPVTGSAPNALDRSRVDTPLELGVRAM
ncbi:MAG TPA: hypothetical protein VMV41_03490, partial [Cellulomonadaceae bacterium]|nr:hypothetical protein [Cellulomonadaceae bacterium]